MRTYEGIRAFAGYMRRTFGPGVKPYDWADLSDAERERYAERERAPRERRQEPRG